MRGVPHGGGDRGDGYDDPANKEPERYTGQNFFELFDGWELSEIVRASGMVRSDGKTLTSQPHLRSERLWTLHDLQACGVVIRDPLTHGQFVERS